MRTTRNGFAPRMAERVAREIELDIIAKGLIAGDSLGNEATLMERYGVSRGVIREAVTLVEHHLQAETRRGGGGGLIVSEPSVDVITEMASLFLARKRVSVAEVFEIRLLLETRAIEDCIAAMDESRAAALREEASRPAPPGEDLAPEAERFHLLLADLSGNGALEMLVPILSGLVKDVWSARHRRPSAREQKASWKRVVTEHTQIAEAIISGDAAAAREHLEGHLRQISDAMAADERLITARSIAMDGVRG